MKCFHCEIKGHTKNKCFKLYGTTDWYNELKKKKSSNDQPKVTLVTTNSDNNNQEEGNVFKLLTHIKMNHRLLIPVPLTI
jgi:hypothetical protein